MRKASAPRVTGGVVPFQPAESIWTPSFHKILGFFKHLGFWEDLQHSDHCTLLFPELDKSPVNMKFVFVFFEAAVFPLGEPTVD